MPFARRNVGITPAYGAGNGFKYSPENNCEDKTLLLNELMLPYAILVLVMVVLRYSDRKIDNVSNEELIVELYQ